MELDLFKGEQRTHYCGELRLEDAGKNVTVCGWVAKNRDLGQLIFIDLRDRTGIVQLSFDNETDREIFDKAFSLRAEAVVLAKGIVKERSNKNMEIPTGEIEIAVNSLSVLAISETPPFEVLDNSNAKEELRLKYRYLDLRRPVLQNNILMRHKIAKVT